MLFLPRTLFLDACVFYPAQTRDLFVRLALKDLVRLKWSRRVQEEWLAAILRERPELSPTQKLRLESTPTRLQEVLAFQEPLVEGYENNVAQIVLPDPEDAHVVAAAFHAGAEAILTFNLKDFPPNALEPWELQAVHPDMFLLELCELLIRQAGVPDLVLEAIREIRNSLKNPPISKTEYLEALRRISLRQFADLLESYNNW